ncbi:hypothetical protein B296_00026830 [Ensete ventricosum]|uniref:Uncharacterized protein n=1 Tax=Ensete ventricosum TaxID=4639 RepID=A0A426ZEZ3_ENSVE|nr:hypothetical protein B296_00026830 [Ensete ventricosum]
MEKCPTTVGKKRHTDGGSELVRKRKAIANKLEKGTSSRDEAWGSTPEKKSNRAKGQEPAKEATEETHHLSTLRELCKMDEWAGEDRYFATRIADPSKTEAGGLLKVRWSNLPTSVWFWTDGSIAVEYARGALHPTITKQLYGAPSKELVDGATKLAIDKSSKKMAVVEKRATVLEAEVSHLKVVLVDAKQRCRNLEQAGDHTHSKNERFAKHPMPSG